MICSKLRQCLNLFSSHFCIFGSENITLPPPIKAEENFFLKIHADCKCIQKYGYEQQHQNTYFFMKESHLYNQHFYVYFPNQAQLQSILSAKLKQFCKNFPCPPHLSLIHFFFGGGEGGIFYDKICKFSMILPKISNNPRIYVHLHIKSLKE